MDSVMVRETSAQRLLYDDAAPRKVRPINKVVLRFRRPGLLFAPLALAISAGLPATGAAFVLGDVLPGDIALNAAAIGGVMALFLLLALVFARREENSFALVTPNMLTVSHAFLSLALIGAFVAGGPMQVEAVPRVLGALPGPMFDELQLQIFKAYLVLFILMTAAAVVSAQLFKFLGLRRVVLTD